MSEYSRVLLKLSGEGLAGESGFGIDPAVISSVAKEIHDVHERGVQIGIVIGGGNVIRGVAASAAGMERSNADYMGMLASVINGMALQDALEKEGIQTRVQTALEFKAVAEPYIRRRAIRHLEKGRIVIFSAGTGNPFFTTDTAAALRAAELQADVVLKATKVDGVYSDDPVSNKNATRYERLRYDEVIERKLTVMDTTAIVLCRDNKMPLRILDMRKPGVLLTVATGGDEGTLVSNN